MGKASLAQLRANIKYDKKTYSRLQLKMRHLEMQYFKKFCKDRKYTYNGFLKMALQEKIERETGRTFQELLAKFSEENQEDS